MDQQGCEMLLLSSNLIFNNIGAPLVTALVIALVAWIVRLLHERKKRESLEKNELITTVAGLLSAVNEITISLGGCQATTLQPKREGIIDAVSLLADQVRSLTKVVNDHTEAFEKIIR